MARQIQIRRGTAAEHESFTGAIGEITMDTTNKTLRVHDGSTAGGTILAKQSEIPDLSNADYVTECQLPTAANNYTWYRKYKSGWVEQGGLLNNQNGATYTEETINLPVQMADTNYCGFVTSFCTGTNYTAQISAKTTSSVKFTYFINVSPKGACWMVCGLSMVAE